MLNYEKEVQELHHRRVNYIVLGGSLMMLLFSLLDYVTAPALHQKFLNYRACVAIFGILLFLVNCRDKNNVFAFWIGFTGFISVIFTILLMIHQLGGALSPYYVGLIVAIALYVTLAPLTAGQTLMAGGLLVVSYVVTIAVTHPLAPPYLVDLFSNLFFMICFILIIATQSWADTTARKSEYLLRKEEDAATAELSSHAETLEEEVKKRTIEQSSLEKRYRQLFNQIVDDVVVISAKGQILQANKHFEAHFSPAGATFVSSFWDIVPESDRPRLGEIFADLFAGGAALANGRISLVRGDTTVVEVEVNGNILLRNDVPQALLLIMRDLSTRKEMEMQLIDSLEIKKKTETSAILVLAKLSEFRDVTPYNHLERIREYCKVLTKELAQLDILKNVTTPTYIEDIYHASILHDIGKVAVPDEYMAVDAPLQEYEKDLLRRHTLIGGDVIREMEEESQGSGFLSMAKHIAYFHHERWDGKGYPYGLAKREIPLAARIVAVADTYEEMTAGAPAGALNIHETAVDFIRLHSETRFDPQIIDCFLIVQSEFNTIRCAFPLAPPPSAS